MALSFELPVLGALLLTAVVALSAAFSFRVWRRRHTALLAGDARPRSRRQVVGAALIGAGALLGAVGMVAALAFPARGELDVQDVFVARAEPDRGVPTLVASDVVARDEVLVRWDRPGDDAERTAVQADIDRLGAQRERLATEPVDVDPRQARAAQLVGSERVMLLQRRETMAFDRHRLDQQGETELVGQRRELATARAGIARLAAQRKGAAAQLEYAETLLARDTRLCNREIASGNAVAERKRDRDLAAAEIDRIDAETEVQQGLATELAAGVARLEAIVATTRSETAAALQQADRELDQVVARLGELDAQAAAQTEQTRARLLRELDLELAGKRARLLRLVDQCRDRASFAGRVVYRHPSPAAAPAGAPLVALAAGDGMLARFRVTAAEARELGACEQVTLELVAGDPVLEPRIPAHFRRSRELPLEPGMAVAELDCAPSWDALRTGLERGRTEVRLLWLAPFWLHPLVRFGLLLALGGAVVLGGPRSKRKFDAWRRRWADAA
jgi:hypothetical protein